MVFRACLVPLHLIAGRSASSVVFLSPLYFGIGWFLSTYPAMVVSNSFLHPAHIHHAYEFYLNHPGAITLTIVRSMFQFAYTTLFGWFATFIFIRTGSAWAAIIVHSFCNHMGLPHLGLVDGPKWKSVVYFSFLFIGAWGFYSLLWSLSDSSNALASFD